ncbi:leucine-rich repeat transmembrane protein kinase protein [Artemisia annua]|uniref:non-specific serine/threonine protein kinase n=1 Tax=Artemisia annua TaxID=35608 RepID=A0A2U1MEP1_ARTAN|nr:leucine-rich repeat transmembrane protein kinase protein [Artemisia annua]
MSIGSFTVLILINLVLTSVPVHATDNQSGFISIDCGIVKGSTYTDNVTGINYVSDSNFIDSGESHNILPVYNTSADFTQLTTLTSFPKNTRNCYTLKPTQGKGYKYLIRARFMYGNYDYINQLPEFDVFLGPDYWDTVNFAKATSIKDMEIIHVLSSDYIHVCLVNTGHGTPFISAIELRALGTNIYSETIFGSLNLYRHVDFGTGQGTIRYKADKYDRLWNSMDGSNYTLLYTSDKIATASSKNIVPSDIMSTALMPPKSASDQIGFYWIPRNATEQFIFYMHFAELEILKRNETREFNLYWNGKFLHGPFSPQYHTTISIYSAKPETAALRYTVTLNKTKRSTLPPIMNAAEIYAIKQLPQRQTNDQDASAMWSIKSAYRLKKNWQGDPCVPLEYVWDGISCRYNETGSHRIVSLNLSTSGLDGPINPALANLAMIHTLDLSNNILTGIVPSFLAGLIFLKVLKLKGNYFTGPIPAELLAKSNKGLLSLSFDGEPTSYNATICDTNRCRNKKDVNRVIVPVIIATVSFIFMIVTALTVVWMIKKKKEHGTRLEIRKKYTYSELQRITNNFNHVIGRGGFGTVYLGNISDKQVAVKILSKSSLQGDKEFQAEASILLNVHHKNLTLFMGYCNDISHKGIIYEYMVNGNLERHLFADAASSYVLNWEERLQIGSDAAHGLEYLHHGCKPPIVHRDIKCTNILLNETFQATLADFGLSRAFPAEGGTHISTAVAGTPGYLDPDLKLAEGNVKNIVDSRLLEDFDMNSAWRAVELAMSCVVDIPNRRPTMKDVVMELNDCLAIERARQETEPVNLNGNMSINLESVYDPDPR